MSPPGCVAFDLDDTLFLEREYVRSGFGAVGEWARARLGLDGFGSRAWRAFEEGVRSYVFDEVLRSYGLEPDPPVVAALVRVYREHQPQIELLSDAESCLHGLKRSVVIVITDGPPEAQRAKLRTLGAERWAAHCIVTDELGIEFRKPHERAFLLAERLTGRRGSDLVYVADNPLKDFAAPAALGWRTVRVRRRDGERAAIDSEVAQLELPDLSGLNDALAGWV